MLCFSETRLSPPRTSIDFNIYSSHRSKTNRRDVSNEYLIRGNGENRGAKLTNKRRSWRLFTSVRPQPRSRAQSVIAALSRDAMHVFACLPASGHYRRRMYREEILSFSPFLGSSPSMDVGACDYLDSARRLSRARWVEWSSWWAAAVPLQGGGFDVEDVMHDPFSPSVMQSVMNTVRV